MRWCHRLFIPVLAVVACAAVATVASPATAGAIADPQTLELDRLRENISVAKRAVPVFRSEGTLRTRARLTASQRAQYEAQSKFLHQSADRLRTLRLQMESLAAEKKPKLHDLERMNERFWAFDRQFAKTSAGYGRTSAAAKARHDRALAALR